MLVGSLNLRHLEGLVVVWSGQLGSWWHTDFRPGVLYKVLVDDLLIQGLWYQRFTCFPGFPSFTPVSPELEPGPAAVQCQRWSLGWARRYNSIALIHFLHLLQSNQLWLWKVRKLQSSKASSQWKFGEASTWKGGDCSEACKHWWPSGHRQGFPIEENRWSLQLTLHKLSLPAVVCLTGFPWSLVTWLVLAVSQWQSSNQWLTSCNLFENYYY